MVTAVTVTNSADKNLADHHLSLGERRPRREDRHQPLAEDPVTNEPPFGEAFIIHRTGGEFLARFVPDVYLTVRTVYVYSILETEILTEEIG